MGKPCLARRAPQHTYTLNSLKYSHPGPQSRCEVRCNMPAWSDWCARGRCAPHEGHRNADRRLAATLHFHSKRAPYYGKPKRRDGGDERKRLVWGAWGGAAGVAPAGGQLCAAACRALRAHNFYAYAAPAAWMGEQLPAGVMRLTSSSHSMSLIMRTLRLFRR